MRLNGTARTQRAASRCNTTSNAVRWDEASWSGNRVRRVVSLNGKRAGQRSIRLSRGYRAYYIIATDGSVEEG